MLINLRNALVGGKRKPTAKDYVQDGLIALWDGIENAGWGAHDASATTWKDLSGNNNDLVLQNGAHFDANSLISADRNYVSALLAIQLPYASIEVCGFWDQDRNPSALVCFGNSSDNRIMLTAALTFMQTYNGSHQITFNEAVSPYNTWAGVHDGSQHIPYVAGVVAMGTYSTNSWIRRDGNFGLSGSSNYSGYNFVGNYYCVRLYSRALTADEIAANYAIDKARFGLP